MNSKWKVCFLVLGGLVFGADRALAAPAPPAGGWAFTFFLDPDRASSGGPPACINFTAATSDPNSGTWTSNFANGLKGHWMQIGTQLTMVGFTNGSPSIANEENGVVISDNNITGLWNSFKPSTATGGTGSGGGFVGIGSFSALKGGGCP